MTTPIRALIVDDEPYARRKLRGFLAVRPEVSVVEEANDGIAAGEKIASFHPDLVFLDIRMPGLSGIELARVLERDKPPYLVFTTAYDVYAVQAFELDAVDYLLKPFDRGRFDVAMDRALRRMARGRNPPNAELLHELLSRLEETARKWPVGEAPLLSVRSGKGVRFLQLREVSRIRASGDYVEIAAGAERIRAREHIGDLEKRLEALGFVRIHRSVLINAAHVSEIRPAHKGDQEFVLATGECFVASAAYKDQVKDLMQRIVSSRENL